MKRATLYQSILSALLLLAGCADKDHFDASSVKGNHTIVATIEGQAADPNSRTAVDESGGVTWVDTDTLGVFAAHTDNAPFISTGSGASVTFKGDLSISDEAPEWAYYPYDADAVADGNSLSLTLPSKYVYTGNSNAPMLGRKTESGDFLFTHLCGLLKITIINIPENATKFIITSENKSISGCAEVNDITVSNALLEIDEKAGNNSVTYFMGANTFTPNKVFYIPLPEGNYEKLTVSLQNDNQDVYFERSISNATIKRAVMLEMPVIGCEEGISYTFSEEVFPLMKQDESYIVSTENNVIKYLSSLPEGRRPQVGQILLYNEITDLFPCGFLGRVTKVTELSDGFDVETEAAALDEAFENLRISKNVALYDGSSELKSRTPTSFPIKLPLPLEFKFGYPTEKPVFYAGLKGGVEAEGTAIFDLIIENHQLVLFNFDAVYTLSKFIGIECGFELANEEKKKETQTAYLLKLPNAIISTGPIVCQPTFLLGLALSASGKGNVFMGWEGSSKIHTHMKLDNMGWNNRECSSVPLDGTEEPMSPNISISLEGSIAVGPKIGYALEFYNLMSYLTEIDKKELGSIGISAGLLGEIAANFSLDITKALSGELYTAGKEIKASTGSYVNLEASVAANLFKSLQAEASIGLDVDLPYKQEWYLMPTVENLSIDMSQYKENESILVEYSLTNKTLCPLRYGVKIYDENQQIVFSDYGFKEVNDGYVFTQNLDRSFCLSVDGLERGKTYKAVPFMVLFGVEILTDEELEFTIDEAIIVTTDAATDITSTTALLSGFISDGMPKGEFKYGFCYSTMPDLTEANQIENMGDAEENTFSITISSLLPNTQYYWCAFVVEGNTYYYGEIKEFTTKEDLEGYIATGIATKITDSSAILPGNIQVYDADDFMHRYGICYSTEATPNPTTGHLIYADNIQENGDFSVQAMELAEGTTYYYRAFVLDGSRYIYGEIMSFTTKKSPENMTDRDILIAFYEACGGENWEDRHKRNWLSNSSLGQWAGVTVNSEGRVTSLKLANSKKITGEADLRGLAYLQTVQLYSNALTSLDVSGCAELKSLNCSGNLLESIDFSGCTKLTSVSIDVNRLSSYFDFSMYPELTNLTCAGNSITDLNVSGCEKIETLSCSSNKLTKLDISDCKKIETLSCAGNELTELDVSNCTALKELSCSNNNLERLNISGLTEITRLQCYGNKLTELNVEKLTNLYLFSCYDNQLKKLDVSNFASLNFFDCYNNSLESLNVSGCSSLIRFSCGQNAPLTSLDVSNLPNLQYLSCAECQLSTLNCEGSKNLISIACYKNQLTSMHVAGYEKLDNLRCSENQISDMDVSGCNALSYIDCKDNGLSSLDISDLVSLKNVYCGNNQIQTLNASGCTNLTFIDFQNTNTEVVNFVGCSSLTTGINPSNRVMKVYLSSGMGSIRARFGAWGDYDVTKYLEPNHKGGYQYPEFIYE